MIDLGCWNDTGNRAISGPPQQYGYTVETCKQYALNNGSDIFALQHGGWCTINKPDDNYRKYGAATGSCPTLGGGWVNHVYKINKKTDIDIDTQASRLYSINNTIHNEHIGKVGYVNHMGQLHLYPDTTMTTYNDSFEQIGSYNISSGSEIGTATNASTVSDCQEKCVSNGDTQKCAGFVFDTTTAMCQLLNNTMVTKNRIIDGKKQYYIREKGVKNQDISCPLDVNITNAKFWNDTVINPTNMTSTTKCGLAKYTENERAAVANKLPNVYDNIQYKDPNNNVSDAKYRDLSGNEPLLNKNKNGFKYWYESLQYKYDTMIHNLFNTKEKINTTFSELEDSRQNLADWTGEQLQNLEAMNEDRDLNMMSQNYRHIMWSILAIMIIMATMKFTKSVAQNSAS